MNYRLQVEAIIAADPARLRILKLIQELQLPDCWVGAGFVRSAVWDHLHQRAPSPLPADIDVIWFDRERASPEVDTEIEVALRGKDPGVGWSVKNQARMHLRNGDLPYSSATNAMTYWPETATAVAVRLGQGGELEVAAPFGLSDLYNLVVCPTERFKVVKREAYLDRLREKDWLARWPNLKVVLTE